MSCHQLTTIAILGADTLVEDSLARPLQDEGYATRLLESHPVGLAEGMLEDLDLLLLTPGLAPGVREAFLSAMRSALKTAAIPVLPLSADLKEALLNELAASASWRSLFEELVEQIGTALEGAAASVRALLVDGVEDPCK